jgi:hypothetical protein
MTVFLEPEVHRAAKQRAGEMKLSLSATVAEAAKESLLSSYRSDREKEILKAAERNFFALRRLEQRMRIELQVLKELIGLGMRSFFNHIPPIPDTGKAAALLSGKQRFLRYLDMVASNLRGGESVLGDVPLPAIDEAAAEPEPGEVNESKPTNAPAAAPESKRGGHRSDRTVAATESHKIDSQSIDVDGQIGLFDTQPSGGKHGT